MIQTITYANYLKWNFARFGRIFAIPIMLMALNSNSFSQVANIAVSRTSINASANNGSAVTRTFTISNSGNAPLNYSIDYFISEESFSKEDFADFTLPENQDEISDNVRITRGDTRGIFNIAKETSYANSVSPIDTEWSFGETRDLAPEDYTNWVDAVGGNPPSMIGNVISMHVISENRYFDILFNSWTAGAGGGFGYSRAEIPTWLTLPAKDGQVAAKGSQNIKLTFTASPTLPDGIHTAFVRITSNTSTPEILIPVEFTVSGGQPVISADAALDFGDAFVGFPVSQKILIKNTGTAVLSISNISSDNVNFSTTLTSLDIEANSSYLLDVNFSPRSKGVKSGILTLTSNDPANSTMEISLTGKGLIAPNVVVSHNDLVFDVSTGGTVSETITIQNTQGVNLDWQIEGQEIGSVSNTLENLNSNYEQILNSIPNRFNFNYDRPNYISDGGNDMYDGGNVLSTDIYYQIPYSDNILTDGTAYFGNGTNYFTRHLPGLFVLGAELNGIELFEISGNLGADGGGSTNTTRLEVVRNEIQYTGYVKRVFGTSDPSVNHLIIVEKNQNFVQSASNSTDDDFHELSNISSAGFMYYLLYAGGSGTYIDNDQTEQIMLAFLNAVNDVPPYISLTSKQGSTVASESFVNNMTIDLTSIPEGKSQTNLFLNSNDPDEPSIVIPITFTNNTFPKYSADKTALVFGNAFIGYGNATATVEIQNNGSDQLTISSIASSLADVTVNMASVVLAPKEKVVLEATFTPTSEGLQTGNLTLTTNDTDNSTVLISLEGVGQVAPDINVNYNDLVFDVSAGGIASENIVISNSQGINLDWTIKSGLPSSLPNVLAQINTNYQQVLDVIPNRYDFVYDGSINYIDDGGSDMYDGGNYISTDIFADIPYSDDVLTDGSGYFGEGTSYFTRHLPGLFVLGTELNGITNFEISGNLGADGGGLTDMSVIEVERNGVSYMGFIKRVYNAGDPSVNHLIIIEQNDDVTHQSTNDTNSDFHQLSNLSDTKRLYYLLYAGDNGSYIDDEETRQIMVGFLDITMGYPDYLTLTPNNGSTSASETVNVDLTIDLDNLPEGISATNLYLNSNDPDESQIIIPITFNSNTFPRVSVNPSSLTFSQTFIGHETTLSMEVRNTGSEQLEVSDISSDMDEFTFDVTSLSLAPGERANVEVTFSPNTEVGHNATITLSTNDPDNNLVTVTAFGSAAVSPAIAYTPGDIAIQMFPGESTSLEITIQNTQGIDLQWDISSDILGGAIPAYVSLTQNSGTTASGVTETITFNVNADDVPETRVYFNLLITSNDPNNSVVTIPVDIQSNEVLVMTDISNVIVNEGFGNMYMNISSVFSEVNNETLSFDPASSVESVALAEIVGTDLIISEIQYGTTTISIAASNSNAKVAYANFSFRINAVPVVSNSIADIAEIIGFGSTTVDIREVFSDKDVNDVLTYSIFSTNPEVVDVILEDGILTITEAGPGTSYVTIIAQDGYGGEVSEEFEVFVDKNEQVIIFDMLENHTYGDAAFNLVATGGESGNPIIFTSSDESVVSISEDVATITGAGAVTITASQAGSDTYNPAFNVAQYIVISKAPLTSKADNKVALFGQQLPQLTVSFTGLVNGDGPEVLNVLPVATTTANGTSTIGIFSISVSGGEDNNYEFVEYLDGTLTIETVTGVVDDITDHAKFVMYPNPANEELFISMDDVTSFDFIIYNSTGRMIISEKQHSISESININMLNAGVYLLFVKTETQTIQQKFIKN